MAAVKDLVVKVDSVYVNGVLVYKDKQFTGAAPGKMLRHNA